MYDIRSNNFENHLSIIIKGKLELAEATQAAEKIDKAVKVLMSGFTVITDIRELVLPAENVRQVLLGAMQVMKNARLGFEMRVVNPQNMVTANRFQRTSRAAGYTAQEVSTINEAEKFIDQLVSA
ncbi:MAG: hypothetical protein JW908_09945 [Anaerolineales bacterium]|nr:hypothetical protein [Anaerolineales bacterium]